MPFRVFQFALAALFLLASAGVCPGRARAKTASAPHGYSKIKHVIVIFQENRSVDNLFHGFPGADTAAYGLGSRGQRIPMTPLSISAMVSPEHAYSSFLQEYDNGKMDGFDKAAMECYEKTCPAPGRSAFTYVPRAEIEPYWQLALRYSFGDRMFQTQQGPSYEAHLYLISGSSAVKPNGSIYATENPASPAAKADIPPGCAAVPGSAVDTMDIITGVPADPVFPCLEEHTIIDELDKVHLSWRYYQTFVKGVNQNGVAGMWSSPLLIGHLYDTPSEWANVSTPPSNIFNDIASDNLANVSWVTPTAEASDHATATDGSGPSWVASIVDAVGNSKYWKDTAIIITWDDWGGYYDHVRPPMHNKYELGFRVPLIVVSPYVRRHYVSHTQHDFGSILRFMEQVYGLPSLGTADTRSDDFADMFDFTNPPKPFVNVPVERTAAYFMALPPSDKIPDDDF